MSLKISINCSSFPPDRCTGPCISPRSKHFAMSSSKAINSSAVTQRPHQVVSKLYLRLFRCLHVHRPEIIGNQHALHADKLRCRYGVENVLRCPATGQSDQQTPRLSMNREPVGKDQFVIPVVRDPG